VYLRGRIVEVQLRDGDQTTHNGKCSTNGGKSEVGRAALLAGRFVNPAG
jgi:hypothetical protein